MMELVLSPNEILNPLDGEILDITTTDRLIDALEAIEEADRKVYAAKQFLRERLTALAQGGTKTQRVAGDNRTVVVEFPDDRWSNAALKAAWNDFLQFREQYLRISEVKPNLREVKKLAATSGTPELEAFKRAVLAANEGPQGAARIKIEK